MSLPYAFITLARELPMRIFRTVSYLHGAVAVTAATAFSPPFSGVTISRRMPFAPWLPPLRGRIRKC
jgi:hypothetical protein